METLPGMVIEMAETACQTVLPGLEFIEKPANPGRHEKQRH